MFRPFFSHRVIKCYETFDYLRGARFIAVRQLIYVLSCIISRDLLFIDQRRKETRRKYVWQYFAWSHIKISTGSYLSFPACGLSLEYREIFLFHPRRTRQHEKCRRRLTRFFPFSPQRHGHIPFLICIFSCLFRTRSPALLELDDKEEADGWIVARIKVSSQWPQCRGGRTAAVNLSSTRSIDPTIECGIHAFVSDAPTGR